MQRLELIFLALLAAFTFILIPVRRANADSNVVVSAVYGGGGNENAFYKYDFIELFNRSAVPISLAGFSVQYTAAAGTMWQKTDLTGAIQPWGYYLIRQAQGGPFGVDLPPHDASGTIAMNAVAGKVALVIHTSVLFGTCPGGGVVDFVGYGAAATCFEGSAAVGDLSNTHAAIRLLEGCIDTDRNFDDFAVGLLGPFGLPPRNSSSPRHNCSIRVTPTTWGTTKRLYR